MNTPTPWMLQSNEWRHDWRVANKDYVVAWMQALPTHDEDKANAALIVRAVNSHQALIDALENIVNKTAAENATQADWDQCDAALKLAKGET